MQHSPVPQDSEQGILHIPERTLLRACCELFSVSGIAKRQAIQAAKTVIWADSVGLKRAGTWQMPMLMNLICQKSWSAQGRPTTTPLNRVGATVAAHSAPGPSAMEVGLEQAAAYADLHGWGVAVVLGAAGVGHPLFWSWKAAQMGFASLIFSPLSTELGSSQTSPLPLIEPAITQPACGNPITFGAPGNSTVHLLGEIESAMTSPLALPDLPTLLPGSEVLSEVIAQFVADACGAPIEGDSAHLVVLLKPRQTALFQDRIQAIARQLAERRPFWSPEAIAGRRKTALKTGIPLDMSAYLELARLASQLEVPFPAANLESAGIQPNACLIH